MMEMKQEANGNENLPQDRRFSFVHRQKDNPFVHNVLTKNAQLVTGDEQATQQKKELRQLILNDSPVQWDKPQFTETEYSEMVSWTGTHMETGWTVVKIEVVIDCDPTIAFDIITNADQILIWDTSCQEASILEELDRDNHICYYSFALSMPARGRDVVLYRSCERSSDNMEYWVSVCSVAYAQKPEIPEVVRITALPSGYYLKAVEGDPSKTCLTLCCHTDLKLNFDSIPDMPGSKPLEFMVKKMGISIQKYVRECKASTERQYLMRMEQAVQKEIFHSFFSTDAEMDIWKQVLQTDGGLKLFKRKSYGNRVMACTNGVFTLDMPPKDVFEVFAAVPPGASDPLSSFPVKIEDISESAEIWHFDSISSVTEKVIDFVVLRSRRVAAGIHLLMWHSVVHSRVPVYPDKTRMCLFPSAFLIHPVDNNKSLVSYCVQMDLQPYFQNSPYSEATEAKIHQYWNIRLATTLDFYQRLAKQYQEKKFDVAAYLQQLKESKTDSLKRDPQLVILASACKAAVNQQQLMNEKRRSPSPEREPDRKKPKLGPQIAVVTENTTTSLPSIHSIVNSTAVKATLPFPPRRRFAFVLQKDNNCTPRRSWVCTASLLEVMPNEVLLNIMGNLDMQDLQHLGCVTKRFYELSMEDSLWKNLYHRWYGPSDSTKDWKTQFKNAYGVERNWNTGNCARITVNAHHKAVKCLQFNQNYVVTGSGDKRVKVWNRETLQPVHTFAGVSSSVVSLAVTDDDKLTVAYKNGKIVTWDINSTAVIREKQFSFSSEGFRFTNSCIVSWNVAVHLWELESGNLKLALEGHTKKVTNVAMLGSKLASSSADKTVKLWDMDTGTCITTYQGHTAGVGAVAIDENHIASGGNDKIVRLWDIRSPQCIAIMKGHVCPITSIQLNSTKLLSGGLDNVVMAWDIAKAGNYRCLQRMPHDSPVLCLSGNNNYVFVGTQNGDLVLWDFQKTLTN